MIGRVVCNGAPYATIGYTELCSLAHTIKPGCTGELDAIPDAFAARPRWQYGVEDIASASVRILFSVAITAVLANGTSFFNGHLVLERSSQWVTERNFTSRSKIMQLNDIFIIIPGLDSKRLSINLIDHDYHLYLPRVLFAKK